MPAIPIPYRKWSGVMVVALSVVSAHAEPARKSETGYYQVEIAQIREYSSVQRYKTLVSQASGKGDSVFERELRRGKAILWVRSGSKGLSKQDLEQTVEALTHQNPGATRAAASVGEEGEALRVQIDLPTRIPDRSAASEPSELDPDMDVAPLLFLGES